MKMKCGVLKVLAVGAAFVMTVSTVQAIPISGSIQFTGYAILDHSLPTATAFTRYAGLGGSGPNPVVLLGSQTGHYSSVPDWTPATWTTFTFVPTPVSVDPLWTFTVGGKTYSFKATSVTEVEQSFDPDLGLGFLDIAGTGVAHIDGDGLDDTVGSWSITGTGNNLVFTFGAATSVAGSVPDGGTTIILLGVALSGFGLIRKKIV